VSPFIWSTAREGINHHPQYRIVGDCVECRGVVTYNVTSGPPPAGTMLKMPVGLRPARTCGNVVFFDCASPLYFGYGVALAQQSGDIVVIAPGSPNPMTNGAFSIEGLKWYLS